MCDSDTSDTSYKHSDEKDELNRQLSFVTVLQRFPVLLNKSQTPVIKQQKGAALVSFCKEYRNTVGINICEDQVRKKINNMKTDIKKKTDFKRTGNKKIILKKWEEQFLELLNNGGNNPVVSQVPGACSAGLPSMETKADTTDEPNTSSAVHNSNFHRSENELSNSSSNSSIRISNISHTNVATKASGVNKNRFNETEETRSLSTVELQRLVLLEQLKLIRMQQEKIKTSEVDLNFDTLDF